MLEFAIQNYKPLIGAVVCGRDAGIDNDFYTEIVCLCESAGIVYYDRSSFDIPPGYRLAIGWRWMLPVSDQLLIIHDALLPRYRGFAPLVNSLICGDDEIGATVLYASDKFDCGPIVSQASLRIEYPIKIRDAINLMSDIYIHLVDVLLNKINNGELIAGRPQAEELATYSLWRDNDDYWVDWDTSVEEIVRFVDAVGAPYAGARCLVNGVEAIIQDVSKVSNVSITDRRSAIGKVLFFEAENPIVVCINGLLRINKITSLDGQSILPLNKFRARFTGRV